MSKLSTVGLWNLRCNNVAPSHDNPDRKQILLNQLARIEEEVQETKDAILAEDNVEILDGLVDIRVVTEGLGYLARLDAEEAFTVIMQNNNLKFTDIKEFAEASRIMLDPLNEGTHEVQERYQEGITFYSVHRKADNKICKLLRHPRPDISGLVSEVQDDA